MELSMLFILSKIVFLRLPMKKLFESFNVLSTDQLDKLDGLIYTKNLKKGEYLIEQGMLCDEIAFIDEGILRSFYINDAGDDITNCIAFSGELMAAYSSFITSFPAEDSIQALVTTRLTIIKKENLEALYAQSEQWQQVGRMLAEMQYVELERRIASFQKETGVQRYETMLRSYPNYIKHIPLRYLATFLGVTPRHLSRIRASYKALDFSL